MDPDETNAPSLERFAAERLGLEGDDLLASLLRRIGDEDFLPDPVSHDALRVLYGRPIGVASWLAEEAAQAEESRLRDEVDRFSADFFEIPPVERRAHWDRLVAVCKPYAGLTNHLRHLGRGLDIDRRSYRDDSVLVERLAGDVFSLFPLRPGPQAVACRQLVGGWREDLTIRDAEMAEAVKQLRERHSPVAMIVPKHFDYLTQPRRPLSPSPHRTKPPPVPKPKTKTRFLPNGVAVFVIFGIIGRFISQAEKNPPTPQRPPAVSPVPNFDLSMPPPTLTVAPTQKPSASFLRLFRDDFKAPIRSGLAELNKPIDDPDLQRVVDALPVDSHPAVGGLATLVLLGYWSERVHGLYASALREELTKCGIVLEDEEFARLVRRCFPSPVKRSGR